MIVPDNLKVGDKVAFVCAKTGDLVYSSIIYGIDTEKGELIVGRRGVRVRFDDPRYSAVVIRYPNKGVIIPDVF